MRVVVVVIVIVAMAGAVEANAPDAYRCYPGKPKLGEGCACPAEHATARDGENTAVCKRVARPTVTPAKQVLELLRHDWAQVALPALTTIPRVRSRLDPPLVTPSPVPQKTGPTDQEVEQLHKQLAATRGPQRLPILDRLVDAIAARAYADPTNTQRRAAVYAASTQLLAEPGFAQYARADLALARHAELEQAANRTTEAIATWGRLISDWPRSARLPDAYVALADRAFEAGDLVKARQGYARAIEIADKASNPRVSMFARYKLGWVAFNESKFLDAKQQWEAVAASNELPLRKQALRDLPRVYAQAMPPDKVVEYFERVDKPTALERIRDVAELYADFGKGAQARQLFRELVVRESDPARICEASMGALRGSLQLNKRDEIGLDVAAFAQVASAADGQCKQDADELLGKLAFSWHGEMRKTRGDAREVIEIWKFALAVVTQPDRRAAMQTNLGYALWTHAASAGGARATDWVAAGLALHEIAGLADVAVDAFDNALRAARGTGQALAPMTVSMIKGTLTKLGTPRAKELLAAL